MSCCIPMQAAEYWLRIINTCKDYLSCLSKSLHPKEKLVAGIDTGTCHTVILHGPTEKPATAQLFLADGLVAGDIFP